MKKFLYLLLLLGLVGCSSGIQPLKKSQLKGYYGRPPELITYTNTVQLVKPESSHDIKVTIPVTVSKPLKEGMDSNILNDIKVDLPQEIIIRIVIPNSTNSVTLSGQIIKDQSIWLSPAAFLYFFVIIVSVLVVIYKWPKKSKSLKAAMKEAENKSVTTTVILPTRAVETAATEEIKLIPSNPTTPKT